MTTVLSLRHKKMVVIGGDGQATLGNIVIKKNVRKVHYLYNKQIIAGFAGSTSDALNLFSLFEDKLKLYQGKLMKSAISLAEDWRNDIILKKLEAILAVADKNNSLIISGNGDVIKPEDNLIAIGSGGIYAQSAAQALLKNTKLNAYEIVKKSLKIASEICIYTNNNFIIKKITSDI
ncbi:ATP-dependent protease subunit HslV [Candidatus Annandia adelgestsuga]|uniref:ATP-dependent protease subunit HslV n=1 Tax=Candidatus Annandia adelgestsuga TaxID=1302411 RepID=A0A3Q9CKZ3_9ENTR|nr:ATP-dependent protease subunit HslV [Candidatus Annandia adelgestsuga]AZP36417.1 ATP-dependent protease subunit HslV [Candidatus Annandia adelgestsuga]